MTISGEELDPTAILAALNVTDARSIAPVAGGQDTAIWRVETGAGPLALRVFREDQQRPARRERETLRCAREAGLPVPQVCAEGEWQGRPVTLI